MSETNSVERGVVAHSRPRQKVAYVVREDHDDRAAVVFAKNGAEARRIGGYQIGVEFEDVDSCRRAPEFDGYAEAGAVPPLVLIEHHWWFECDHCGHRITCDYEGPDGEDLSPVADGDRVYCDAACQSAEWVRKRDIERRMNAVVEACTLTFHGLPITGLRGVERYKHGTTETVLSCEFDFPGRKGMPARWDLGASTVWISECDLETWETIKSPLRHNDQGKRRAEGESA